MSKKFKLIVNTGNAENNQNVDVTQGQGARGQAVRLKAKVGAKYQLLDLEKSKDVGPDYVKVKRVGTLTVLSTDSAGTPLTDSDNITINVSAVDDAPVGVADTASATEAGGVANATAGTNPSGNALTNDSNVDTGDTLTVKDIKAGTAAGAGTAVSASTTSADGTSIAGSFGTLKIGANGSYVYTVNNTNATVQALNTTSTALSDVFTYTVQDGAGLSSTATITVSVAGANDAPVVANAIADTTGTDGTALSYVIPANSFSDVDNSSLTLTATLAEGSALPSWLTFTASTRTFSGTPPTGTGTVSVKVTASDGTLSTSDDFDIVVSAANTAPVANPTVASAASITQADLPELVITDNQSAARVANGATVTYTLTFNEAINASSLTASDISVTNGTLVANSLTKVNDTTWTVQATTAATGSNATVISVADGAYTSASGVAGMGSSGVQAYGAVVAPAGSSNRLTTNATQATDLSTDHTSKSIVALPDGGWVSVYYDHDSTTNGGRMQRYDSSGNAVGGVVTFISSGARYTAVSELDSNGTFVVAFAGLSSDAVNRDIFFRRYDANLNPIGPLTQANTTVPFNQSFPSVANLSGGGFVVTWESSDVNGSKIIFGQRFDASGSKVGSELTIGTSSITSDSQVVGLNDGSYVVVWTDASSGFKVLGQRFGADGNAIGSQLQINTSGVNSAGSPSISVLSNGGFVVTWYEGSNAVNSIKAQYFNESGTAVGSKITVSTTNANYFNSTVATLTDGNVVVAWADRDTNKIGLQILDSSGNKVGTEQTYTEGTSGLQPTISALENGGFVLNWQFVQGATFGIAQKFFGPVGSISVTGSNAAETFAGSDLDDTINLAGGGSDKVFAGAGNDTVTIDRPSRSALVDPNTPDMIIDGGSGINALVYTNTGTGNPTVDLTDTGFITDGQSNTTAIQSKLRNFSSIDITSGATNSTIKLDQKFVANISGATDNTATKLVNESKMLVINANAGDVVQLVDLASWSVSAAQSGASLAATYGSAYKFVSGRSYREFSLNGATLFVDSTATVNNATAAASTVVTTGQAVSVQTLFGPSFTDVDSGQTFKGVAITSAGSSTEVSNKGKYQISADGINWTDLAGGLTDTTAIFAAPTALIRYVGAAGVDALTPQNLTVRLIDSSELTGTSGITAGTISTGSTIDASVNGGSTAFSGNLVTLQPSVNNAPVSTDADGVIAGDPFGAATVVASTFADFTGNGTFTFGSNSATVTGNTSTITEDIVNISGFTGKFLDLGSQNADETAVFTFDKPVSEFSVDFVGISSNLEIVRVLVNGQPFVMQQSFFGEVKNRTTGAVTSVVIASDGLGFNSNVANSVLDGTFTIKASDVPGGVINSISLTNDFLSGAASGTLFRVKVPASSATPAQTVADLFGSVYSDVNSDAMQGVVITSAGTSANQTALGKYQWSSNGTTWTDLAAGLGDSTSVYLAKTDLVRFVASSTNGSTTAKPALTARLVDDSQASGTLTSGATVDASGTKNGGTTAISGNTVGYAQVDNTAPVLSSTTFVAPEVINDGTGVLRASTMDTGSDLYIRDPDGTEVTFATSAQTTVLGGALNIGSDQGGSKLIYLNRLATSVDVFTSEMQNGTNKTTGFVKFFAADDTLLNTVTFDTDPQISDTNPVTARSFTASAGQAIAYVEVGGGDNWGWIDKVMSTPVAGTPVIDFSANFLGTAGNNISNVVPTASDADGTVIGYAVTSAAAETSTADSTPGKWQYFNGTAWVDLTGASTTQAVYITKNTKVRWNDNDTTHTTLKLVAVDSTVSPTLGQTLDVSTRGGKTAFSSQEGVLTGNSVAPVVLDLNQDGVIDYSRSLLDVNSDGVLDSTLWAGRKDGVLVWDKYHDGQVHNHTQYAFTEYGGSTDLEGLAAGFDSNHDGVLSAADAKFAEFKVWQDIDQDGVSDAGEVRSLADWGITSINLVSDGVVRTPVAGVTEAGQSSAQLADGSSVLVADAAFEFRAASAAEAASHAVAQGENVFRMFGGTSLDLSAVTGAAQLSEVNASADTAANTIKLTLADVFGASGVNAVSGDLHQLMLTGDTNDTAELSANEWLSTNTTVTQNGQTYAVYNAANDAAAQLLIDQHMAVVHNG